MRAIQKLAVALGVCVWAAEAHAQGGWTRLPTNAEREAAYPAEAKAAGLPGVAWVTCQLPPNGMPRNCRIEGETPEERGFGKAALELAALLRAAPVEASEPALVTVPFRFGGAWPSRPVRAAVFKTSDGRIDMRNSRFQGLAPVGPYWPETALRTGLSGRAAIDCRVDAGSRLQACVMVGDRTTSPLFGHAMLTMARTGWMSAAGTTAGVSPPADGVWRFELDFPARTLEDAGIRLPR